MQVTIEIKPSTVALLQKVKEKGVSLDDLLRDAIDKIDSHKHLQDSVSAEEWITSLRNWSNASKSVAVIPDDALRRSNLYEDRVG